MQIIFTTEPDENGSVCGLVFPLAKRRGGPKVILGDVETWHATFNGGTTIPVHGRMPVDPTDRERAVQAFKMEANIVWGAVVSQQLSLINNNH